MLIYVLYNLKWAIGVKKKPSLLCFVLFANMSLVGTDTISNTSIYQPQSVSAKLLTIQGHIKMRDDVLYKCVIDECTVSCHSSNRIGYC